FRATRRKAESSSIERADVEETTPEESLGLAYQRLSQTVAVELIETVMKCSPAFFERLVIDLLVGMGYGGTRHDAGRAIGRIVDGDTLAQLMIEHNVGVSSAASYEVKRIDHDYFTEE